MQGRSVPSMTLGDRGAGRAWGLVERCADPDGRPPGSRLRVTRRNVSSSQPNNARVRVAAQPAGRTRPRRARHPVARGPDSSLLLIDENCLTQPVSRDIADLDEHRRYPPTQPIAAGRLRPPQQRRPPADLPTSKGLVIAEVCWWCSGCTASRFTRDAQDGPAVHAELRPDLEATDALTYRSAEGDGGGRRLSPQPRCAGRATATGQLTGARCPRRARRRGSRRRQRPRNLGSIFRNAARTGRRRGDLRCRLRRSASTGGPSGSPWAIRCWFRSRAPRTGPDR